MQESWRFLHLGESVFLPIRSHARRSAGKSCTASANARMTPSSRMLSATTVATPVRRDAPRVADSVLGPARGDRMGTEPSGRALSSAWMDVTSAGCCFVGNCQHHVLLLLGWESEERAQAPLGHERFGQWVAEPGKRFDDLRCEFKEAQHLSHTGAGNAELAGQVSTGSTLALKQNSLPFLGDDDRVPILPGRVSQRSRQFEEPGQRCGFEVVGQTH